MVSQGADGVFVIKPRPVVAAAPAPAMPAASTPAGLPPPPSASGPLTARAPAKGPWQVGLGAEYERDRGAATGGPTAALGGEYFITDQVAGALAVTAARTHSIGRASARLQSSTLSLRYYFAPDTRLRPYLAAGIDVATLYDANGAPGLDRVSVGPAAAAGLDFSLSPHWLLNAEVGWAQVRPHLDPVQLGLGFVYRFGR